MKSFRENKNKILENNKLLRIWELQNLPVYGTLLGYAVFLELSTLNPDEIHSLKKFYLKMPATESTVRIHLRKMQQDGWIEVNRKDGDERTRELVLTDKFIKIRDEWFNLVAKQSSIISDSIDIFDYDHLDIEVEEV